MVQVGLSVSSTLHKLGARTPFCIVDVEGVVFQFVPLTSVGVLLSPLVSVILLLAAFFWNLVSDRID